MALRVKADRNSGDALSDPMCFMSVMALRVKADRNGSGRSGTHDVESVMALRVKADRNGA